MSRMTQHNAAHFKRRFSSLKTKGSILEMQKFVSNYKGIVVPRINKLRLMYELWCNEKFLKIEPLALQELGNARNYAESLIDPKYDSVLQTFSTKREMNKNLRNTVHRIREVRNKIVKCSITVEAVSELRKKTTADISATNFPSVEKSQNPFSNVGEFSERFFHRERLYVGLYDEFDMYGIPVSSELESLVTLFNKDRETFYQLDYFQPIINELNVFGVAIEGSFRKSWSLSYEKDYHFRMSPKLALKCLDERLVEVSKQDRLRNLQSMAAKNTEEQRNVARSERSVHTYQEQKRTYDQCPYCFGTLGNFEGDRCSELDHIHPVSKGGLSTAQNLVFICSNCNRKKSAQTLNQFIISENLERDALFVVLGKLGKYF